MRKFPLPKAVGPSLSNAAVWSRRGFYVSASDWDDPSAHVYVLHGPREDGFEWSPTGLQVADCRHDPSAAARMVAENGAGA